MFVYYAKDLPRPEKFTERPFTESTKIYDKTGEVLLYEMYGEEKREIIPIDRVPENVIKAVLAAEDINFYKHAGVDFKGVTRAILTNLRLLSPTQGASTISQQLIRSSLLTREKTIGRKIRELILTIELERQYSKEEILEFYLNQVPFGSNTYGVQAASLTYFKKPVSEASLEEAAVLAAIIKAPSFLSPYGEHKEELLQRKDSILDRMKTAQFILEEEWQKAKNTEIAFAKPSQLIQAPHFVMYVKEYLENKYGEQFLQEKGLKVYTSLDWDLQKAAEQAVKEGIIANRSYYRAFNASLVAIDPKTGEIMAMVGSVDYFGESLPKGCSPGKNCFFEPHPNVSIRVRQPGSSFKPIVYAAAFEKGYNDETVVVDEFTNFGTLSNPYTPQNYDGFFRGPVTLRQALAQSLNIPSVKVLANLAGLEYSIQMAQRLGITSLTEPSTFYGLPLVLGGGSVKLLDMVSVYGVFSTDGLRLPPMAVIKILDSDDNTIEENINTPKRVLDSKITRLITSILSDNNARAPVFGWRSPMYFENYQVAAKTGTTQDYKDGWIIGYTPSIVAGVWVGNNDNTPMLKEPGIIVAGPIWRAFIEKAIIKTL
ncbi:MAG: Penicillin-binding protein, 1A family [Parcubacteria group bacterium GW2011_GWA1_36_12]|nr:MAG: Penicillin-binding protein, 1A family [Parcubacteria group bacterium GW2011_GWA1_36_12]